MVQPGSHTSATALAVLPADAGAIDYRKIV